MKITLTESQLERLLKNNIDVISEDVNLLRTLAPKSIIWFGQYKGASIQQLLNLGKTRYLRGLYYDIAGISFMDDILKEIGVWGDNFDYRISKPGIDHEMKDMVDEKKLKHTSLKSRSHMDKVMRTKMIGNRLADQKKFSKGSLQAWNQGKK